MNILFISPLPIERQPKSGGSLRRYQAIEALSKLAQIEIISPFQGQEPMVYRANGAKLMKKIKGGINSINSHLPAPTFLYQNRNFAKKVMAFSKEYEITFVDHIWMSPYLPFIRGKRALISHGDEQLRLKRQGSAQKYASFFWNYEAHRCENLRKLIAKEGDLIITIDENERKKFQALGARAINIPPWAVEKDGAIEGDNNDVGDLCNKGTVLENQPCPELIFLGHSDWGPNKKAVAILKEKIWPLVKSRIENARLTIIGGDYSSVGYEADILNYSWIGDLSQFFTGKSVFVAPIVDGHGLRLKMLMAASYGLPLVGSPLAFENMEAKDGHHCIVAKNPSSMAQSIIKLFEDGEYYSYFSRGAKELAALYSREKIEKKWHYALDILSSSANNILE